MREDRGSGPVASVRSGWIFAGILLAGTVLRLYQLDLRPLHGDEAVGAFLSLQVRDTGSHTYESANRHGPFQYFLGGAAMSILGDSDFAIRFPFALAGSLLPLAALPLRRRFTDPGWLLVAGYLAFSPAFLYFSRYAIQEIDFILATLLLLGAGETFATTGSGRSLFVFLLIAAWMVTLKETFLIVWGCLALSCILGALWGGAECRSALRGLLRRLRLRLGAAGLGLAAALGTVGAAYTDGFRDSAGLRNLLSNLREMLRLGAVSPEGLALHHHPVMFYVVLLLRYEWPILLPACLGLWTALRRGRAGMRLLALYTLVVTGVHFALPYKTPWLILSPLLPLTLMAAHGGGVLLERRWPLTAPSHNSLLAATLVPFLCLPQSVSLSYFRPADPTEPMVYHPSGPDQLELARDIRRLASRLPEALHPKALICLPYAWPLAWYLRDRQDILYQRSPVPRIPAEATTRIPLVVTLARADRGFLKAFTGRGTLPDFTLPSHRVRSYMLIPPDYNVAQLWVRSDLPDE